MPKKSSIMDTLPAEFKRSTGWLLGLGILFVLLGCIGLGMVVGLTLISVLFLGVILMIAGFIQIIDVFACKQWRGALWHALVGILYIIAGGIIIYDPILASEAITALIAWVLIFIGIARIMMAIELRHATGWGWLLFAGLTAIILGILILLQWPYSGLWVLGMFIGIELLVNGWTYILIAITLRRN